MYNNPEVLPYDWIKMGGRSEGADIVMKSCGY